MAPAPRLPQRRLCDAMGNRGKKGYRKGAIREVTERGGGKCLRRTAAVCVCVYVYACVCMCVHVCACVCICVHVLYCGNRLYDAVYKGMRLFSFSLLRPLMLSPLHPPPPLHPVFALSVFPPQLRTLVGTGRPHEGRFSFAPACPLNATVSFTGSMMDHEVRLSLTTLLAFRHAYTNDKLLCRLYVLRVRVVCFFYVLLLGAIIST